VSEKRRFLSNEVSLNRCDSIVKALAFRAMFDHMQLPTSTEGSWCPATVAHEV